MDISFSPASAGMAGGTLLHERPRLNPSQRRVDTPPTLTGIYHGPAPAAMRRAAIESSIKVVRLAGCDIAPHIFVPTQDKEAPPVSLNVPSEIGDGLEYGRAYGIWHTGGRVQGVVPHGTSIKAVSVKVVFDAENEDLRITLMSGKSATFVRPLEAFADMGRALPDSRWDCTDGHWCVLRSPLRPLTLQSAVSTAQGNYIVYGFATGLEAANRPT